MYDYNAHRIICYELNLKIFKLHVTQLLCWDNVKTINIYIRLFNRYVYNYDIDYRFSDINLTFEF